MEDGMDGYICSAMFRKSIFIVLIVMVSVAHAQIESDKALHFLGGNLYGLAGAGIAKQISDGNRWWTFAGAIGGSALIGMGKEAIDAGQENNKWDNQDLLATILGGATVGITIDIFTDHKKNRQRSRRGNALSKRNMLPVMENTLVLDNGLPLTLNLMGLPNGLLTDTSLQ